MTDSPATFRLVPVLVPRAGRPRVLVPRLLPDTEAAWVAQMLAAEAKREEEADNENC